MQLVDRIEKRRFVGREFLLWLWFESELFDATLSTAQHGSFGLWIERTILLSVGAEATRIKGAMPARHREAKEALALGKLPEAAGIHISWGEREISLTLKAERLALTGLALPTVLEEPVEAAVPAARRPPPRRRKKSETVAEEAEREDDGRRESFAERMMLTREIEELLEALYREFLVLRLGPSWNDVVVPAMRVWAAGGSPVNATKYRASRDAALSGSKRRSGAKASSNRSRASAPA